MNYRIEFISRKALRHFVLLGLLPVAPLCAPLVHAQEANMQERMADLKESMARNKQAIAQYTWVEQITISVKGEQKKQEQFEVHMGPDGKPQKVPLDSAPPQQQSAQNGRRGRLKQRIVEKKKEEYEDYAEQMKALTQQYVPPEKDEIQAAYAKGNVTFGPAAGSPGAMKIVIRNYVKSGDSMTLLFDKEKKRILSIQVASYLTDPSDAMNLSVTFDKLPDGTNHVSGVKMDGVSKQLTIVTQNSDYRRI
jgi:hypothetical protein